ncbi:MAG: thioredoxin domain-containing protein [Pseudomonadota bacterium]
MADQTSSKNNTFILIAILTAVFVIGAITFFVMTDNQDNGAFEEASVSIEGDDYPPMPQSIQGASLEELGAYSNNIEPAATEETAIAPTGLSLESFLAERSVGDPNAPVRIDEFASLTCSHCAAFHINTYDAVKEKYIDTGKVYFVFNDFPLDKAALDASITVRCLPVDKHEAFLSLLFKTQRQWAAEGYMKALKQNAKLAGLSDEDFEKCHSDEFKKAFEEQLMKTREGYDIQSTPTFVLNKGQETIRGASSIRTFDQVISKLLAQAESEAN